MLYKKNVLLFYIGFILYLSSYSHSLENINKSFNSSNEYNEKNDYIDLENEEQMNKIYMKIRHYKSIEREPIQHITTFSIEEEKSKKLRALETANIFEDITLVDGSQFYYYLINNWFGRSQTDSQSRVIFYPYSFDHKYIDGNNNTITKHYKQGAFISLKPSEIDKLFFSLKENGTFYAQRSRALFDADIAILSIKASISNYEEELFQDGVDWGTFLHAHFSKGECLNSYETFYDSKKNNPMKKYSTKINEKDIQDGVLLENGIPRFVALIIPDFILGTDDIIKAKLGENGKKKILDYYNKGGTILITGKSGLLFEDFGLINKGTYNRNKLLNIENTERKVLTKGCEDTFNKVYEEGNDDIIKQIVCLRIDKNYKVGLSTTFKTIKEDKSFNTIFELDPEDKDLVLTDTESGLSDPLTEEEKKYNPLVMYKSNENNGKLFVMNLNPFVDDDFALSFNVMMMILSKELFFTSKINLGNILESNEELPIPAGEMGLELDVDTYLHNLNDKKLTKFKLYFFLADNFDWKNIPHSCTKKNNLSTLPTRVKNKKTLESENYYLECNLETINPYERIHFKNTIAILNNLATQMKYQVSLIQIISHYFDSTGKEDTMIENLIGNCQPAPQLRASINPDPSSHYPLYGRGLNSDNVLRIENKEEGKAYDLEYIEMIPLISPIVDSLNQQKINHYLKFYSDYYNKYNFEVPFTSPNAADYIYTSELNNRGIFIAKEFESTILPVKEMNPKVKSGEEIVINGINEGLIIVESTSQIIKQINYRKSDYLYKLGTQRLMVYVDDTTPEGAKTLYGDTIDETIKDPILGNVAKKELAFVRIDIFFYDNINYHNPPEVDKNTFITIDKLQEYKKNKENCSKIKEFSKEFKVVEGYFNNFDENKRKKILEPTIYGNTFFDYCDLNIVNPLNKTSIESNFGDTDNFKLIHYIVPNIDENITQPSQIFDFIEIDKHSGYHKTYTSIKFIYLHYTEFTIINTTCVYGGRITIYLNNVKLNSINDVTFSPEQIAIYNVTYNENENKIIAYFKRGLNPNEQFGKNMKNKIFIENLSSSNNLTFNISLEEVKYDISYPPDFERYSPLSNEKYNFNFISAFSLPALEIRTKLNRTLNEYEVIEPFSKYGLYIQEIGHREVYSSGELHQEKRPGIVMASTFSIITGLGISWVPFNEYLRVGYLFIPSTQTTSRIIWKDVWGRTWQQPLRSMFFDGPPLKAMNNLMMTTTYEVLNNKGQIITEWPSDENVRIHLHIKLLNNFLKLFDIISCKENEMNYIPTTNDRLDYLQKVRTIENNVSSEVKKEDYNGNNMFMRQGVYTSYGVCYKDPEAIVGGKKIGNTYLEDVKKAILCSEKTNENEIAKCIEELKNIPTLNKAPRDYNETERWNYSPLVEKYYPKDYITDDMWNMAFFDYEDSPYEKSFNKHFEVLLPNFDNDETKPENIISIPIYKGLGYNITYNKSQEMNYHGEKKRGWWSDNLQNKDDTLLAGNTVSNIISVDKKSEIKWVNAEALVGSKKEGSTELVKELIANRTRSLYTCLFNRRRPEYNPESNKKFDPMSIVENNVIPIFVDLEKSDKRLYFYDCKDEQYTSENISMVEGNLLKTSTSKDYLYFGANLRGGAKETLNILLDLNYFPKIIYEGIAKINEGARFVYWQPGNLINSYLTVDNPAHFINAKRNDFTVINRLYNPKTTTFNVTLYHSHIIRDDNKINKEWPYSDYYINSYGFGDVSITVSVGGFKKSKAALQPGETTYAKIVFNNNCGFDWNMKGGAIKFEYKGSIPYNSYQILLKKFIHAIQIPLEYCFLNYIIEEPYQPYIKIIPSDHNIEVSPEFFDFENINVVTIRDGFKGEYYLKITVSEDFPDDLRGKPIEIKIEVNTTYFDHFPGTDTDPLLKYHNNYNITVPSLYIAVPFKEGDFKDKVLYTSAQASNIKYFYAEFLDSTVEGVKYINKIILEKLENTTNKDDQLKELNEIWDSLENEPSLEILVVPANSERNMVYITGFAKDYPLFPKKVIGKPDIAEVILLIKSHLTQLRKGGSYPVFFPRLDYKDWSNKGKRNVGNSLVSDARGAWISLSYGRKLVDQISEHIYADSPIQELSPEDEGIMQVQFKLQNIGNGISYKTKYEIIIEPGLEYYDHRKGIEKISEKKIETGQTIITFDLKSSINPGELKGGIMYLKYHKIENDSEIILKIANESSAILDLTDKGDHQVTQHLREPLTFAYKKQKKLPVFIHLIVSGTRKNPSVKVEPKIKYFDGEKEKYYNIYKFKASLSNYNETNNEKREIMETTDLEYENLTSSKDKPCSNNKCEKSNIIYYKVLIIKKDGTISSSGQIKFDKSKIGLSTSEQVLISFSVIFFAFSILFVVLAILRIRHYFQGDLTSKIDDTQLSNLLDE